MIVNLNIIWYIFSFLKYDDYFFLERCIKIDYKAVLKHFKIKKRAKCFRINNYVISYDKEEKIDYRDVVKKIS